MNSVYGYVLEREMPNINLEFCNELAQFDYMFQSCVRESYYGDIVLEGISLKGIWEKIKELWAKFKKWVIEKFNKLREFIKRIFHKTKKDVVDKKIENTPPASTNKSSAPKDQNKSYELAVQNKSRELSAPEDPQSLNFVYYDLGSNFEDTMRKLTSNITEFTVMDILEDEMDKLGNALPKGDPGDALEMFKSALRDARERADDSYEKFLNTDISDVKEIEEKIPFRGVDTYKFKGSVKSSMQRIQGITKNIGDKLIKLNKLIDEAEEDILDMEVKLKLIENELNSMQRRIGNTSEDDMIFSKIAPSIADAIRYDISRSREIVLYMSSHSGDLLNAANKNDMMFAKLERVYVTNGRPSPSMIEGFSKSA